MKAVVVSDLHGDASTAGLPRFEDVDTALGKAVQHAVDIEADAFFVAGDVVTNDPSLHLMIRCLCSIKGHLQTLKEAGIPSWLIPGNHDVFEDGFGTTVIDVLHDTEQDITVVKAPLIVEMFFGRARESVVLLPFTPSSGNYNPTEACEHFKKFADERRLDVKLVLGHLNVEGITSGSEVADFPRGRDVFFPIEAAKRCFPNAVLMNGHIHKRQVFRGVHIIGSLIPLTRGEVHNEPGFLVVEV